jgi:hypothetical protein
MAAFHKGRLHFPRTPLIIPRLSLPMKPDLLALFAFVPLSVSAAKPVKITDNFERGASRRQPTDAPNWRLAGDNDGRVYELHQSKTSFKPPHRSPLNHALLKDVKLGSFTLAVSLKATKAAYDHRDLCLIFGCQDSAHFYYAYPGEKTDDHANQIASSARSAGDFGFGEGAEVVAEGGSQGFKGAQAAGAALDQVALERFRPSTAPLEQSFLALKQLLSNSRRALAASAPLCPWVPAGS